MAEVNIDEPFDTISRPCPEVKEPAREILDHSYLFLPNNKINVEALKSHFIREGRINISDITLITSMAAQLFKKEPNVLDISEEVRVAGDLHGRNFFIFTFL